MVADLSPKIPFGSWLPDLPANDNPGSPTITNVLSNGSVFKPMTALSSTTDAITARAQGHISVIDSTGITHSFCGDATSLYKLSTDGTAWSDVSKSGGYSTGADGRWVFKRYADDVVATNGVDAIQVYTLNSSSLFANLGGSPPVCNEMEIINNFLVLGYTEDGQKQVRWSALGDITDWTSSPVTLAGNQTIEGQGGAVRGISGAQNYGLVIMEREIHRMTFAGPPTKFNFDLIERGRGTFIPSSVISDGRFVYFKDENGFYKHDGTQSIPIGHGRVDKFFSEDYDSSNEHRITAAADAVNGLVMWGYMSTTATTHPDKILVYNTNDDKWTLLVQDHQILTQALTHGLTLEGLDAINASIDALPYSLDSRIWQGGKSLLAGFTTDNKLGYFSGSRLTATLEINEVRLNNGRTLVSGVLPVSDDSSQTAKLVYRDLLTDSVTTTAASSPNAVTGICNFNVDSRYFKAQVTLSGSSWTFADGVHYLSESTGVI